MKTRMIACLIATAVVSTLITRQVVSREPPKPDDKPAADRPQMSEKQKAMMEAWQKAGEVGPNHRNLDPLAGAWTCGVKFYPEPGAPSLESTAKATLSWIFGGRFLKLEYQGDWAGQPFEGIGLLGYDNAKKKYTSMWVDSCSTAIMTELGTYDSGAKTFTWTGTMDCPLNNKPCQVRSTYRIIDNSKFVFEMWGEDESGKMKKDMEITYTRQ